MAHNRDANSSSNEDDTNLMSFQLDERTVDHMSGGSTSYESKWQYKTVAQEVLVVIPKGRQAINWSNIEISFDQDDYP